MPIGCLSPIPKSPFIVRQARSTATAEVACEKAQIQTADQTIVQTTCRLPTSERRKIAEILRSLSAALFALGRSGENPRPPHAKTP